ncbi:MAG: outer membrane lipoprotein-sorting protein [Gammaproteobacteria bacterium]|nr:outer membrane lipoprotein-sorting protein [Gammaproteobacteria bacterium]MDH5305092.1 outer membrane lipoprotein-sorting protein [Gammaproteobacteria bacterium]MDH5322729.1 outer membrane lipoprotein-sorting protein [Gammaproteobacteria bacterium]
MRYTLVSMLTAIALTQGAGAETLDNADEIVARANLAAYYAGADGRSEVRMIISDAQGREQRRQFTVLRRDLDDAGDQSFLVVFSQPSDVRDTVFLVDKHVTREDDRWLYLPGLDLVKRISAGDKRTSFVGAHYFYEDVSGRRPAEDTHELVETSTDFYVLKHVPLDPRSVEFTSYVTWIDRSSFLPMKIDYTNAAGDVYRRVEVIEVIDVEGHPTVTASRVSDLQTGGRTDMQFRNIAYDLGIPADVFTERSLRNPPREWLQRPASR